MTYIRQTSDHGLCLKSGGKFEVEGYCDSDRADDKLTRKSTSGYVFSWAGAAISGSLKRQSIVALSSTESQFIVAQRLCFASKEAIWLLRIMRDVGIGSDLGVKPIKIFAENQGSIKIANNPSTTKRSNYIDIQFHFTRSDIESGEFILEYFPRSPMMADMMADMMTKALARIKVEEFIKMAGLMSGKRC
jgi:hypothetical protein